MDIAIAPTCRACGQSIYSQEHRRQRERCSRKNQTMRAETTLEKKKVITPYTAKRYENGTLSASEFY